MSSIFAAMALVADIAAEMQESEPRMVLEFPNINSMRRFEMKLAQDKRMLDMPMRYDQNVEPVFKYMGIELVLSVRA